jgi:hypothetical protein
VGACRAVGPREEESPALVTHHTCWVLAWDFVLRTATPTSVPSRGGPQPCMSHVLAGPQSPSDSGCQSWTSPARRSTWRM